MLYTKTISAYGVCTETGFQEIEGLKFYIKPEFLVYQFTITLKINVNKLNAETELGYSLHPIHIFSRHYQFIKLLIPFLRYATKFNKFCTLNSQQTCTAVALIFNVCLENNWPSFVEKTSFCSLTCQSRFHQNGPHLITTSSISVFIYSSTLESRISKTSYAPKLHVLKWYK